MSMEETKKVMDLLTAANSNSCGAIAAAQTQAIASFVTASHSYGGN